MRIRNWLFDTWRSIAHRYGYEEYDACVLEAEELYTRKAGDEIVGQLYNFADKGDRRVALRRDDSESGSYGHESRQGTGVARTVVQYPAVLSIRADAKGRKREHFQWNMDLIGLESVAAEVELMSAQVAFLKEVGFKVDGDSPEIVFKVSNRQVLSILFRN